MQSKKTYVATGFIPKTEETVTIAGRKFLVNDPKLFRDVITGELLHRDYSLTSNVYHSIVLERAKRFTGPVNPGDSYTYASYSVKSGRTDHKNLEMIEAENNLGEGTGPDVINFTSISTGVMLIYCGRKNKKALIDTLGLVQGIKNPALYFDKDELEIMDKPRPYRKFDNTSKKIELAQIFPNKLTAAQRNSDEVKEVAKNLIKRNIAVGVESLTYKEFEGLQYTFGIELETSEGRFEEDEVDHLNVKAVHDGSLREADGSNPIGGEYVTGVLTGDAGLYQLHEICRVLQTKCKVDKRCGTHVHIGSLNWNKEDVVYSYLLAELLEKDIFSILPPSRRANTYCRAVDKIALASLKEIQNAKTSMDYNIAIETIFNSIFCLVSGGHKAPAKGINKDCNHPKGSKCGYDKSAQRYCWLNYVTLMFNTKGAPNSHTLEFRPMSGTLNYEKVKNWLKVCMAFCSFVENHKSLIRNANKVPVTLELVISKTFPKTGQDLVKHLNERKQIFNLRTADETIDYVVDSKIKRKSMKEVVCVS